MSLKPKSKKTAAAVPVAIPKTKLDLKKKVTKGDQSAPPSAPIAPLPTTVRTRSTTTKKVIAAPAKAASKASTVATRAPLKNSLKTETKDPRDRVLTDQERFAQLKDLASLKKASEPIVESVASVDAGSGPPPAVSTPVEIEPSASGAVDRGQPIPEQYGMDRLMVLARDAQWLFAYWELRGGALDRLRFQHSAEVIDNARWVLRVRTVHDMNEYLVDVDMRIGQWYLRVAPETRFVVDLGFTDNEGRFVAVLRGQEIRTPRQNVASLVDERWMVAREDLEKLLRVGRAQPVEGVGGSSSLARIARSEVPRATALFSGLWANRQAQ